MPINSFPQPKFLDSILEVRNLETHFSSEHGAVKAVNNVSFRLRKGETIGIVGESGSGKSVTSLSILKLIASNGKIANGEIIFNSKTQGIVDLVNCTEAEMRKFRGNEISMIFQEPMTSLNPVFTCGNQVAESIILHQKLSSKEAKIKTIELFEKVKLPRPAQIYDSYPHQLSGGQKQRVMIAMAMCCNPAIMIADEPTTALDVTVQATILDLMRKLKEEQDTSIIFITHDLGVIAEIADRILVMYQGKIVEQGTVWNIFSNPKHPYTKGLLACRPKVNVNLKRLPTVSDFMDFDEFGNITEKVNGKFTSVEDAILKNIENKKPTSNQKYEGTLPILQVKNLKTYFPIQKGWFKKPTEFVKAVDDVSFDVYAGETLGLVGESGCGKTTLGRTILQLVKPTAGEIIFEGKNIVNISESELRKQRKDMQIIFQDPYSSLNPRIPIGAAIMEPMRVHNLYDSDFLRKKHLFELLEIVGLKHQHFNRYPHEFSGGQRQRICIARALALNPKFIICDESVSALDVSVQAQVLNLLNSLKEQFKFTCIFISHDLSVVRFMSDRIIVMNKGKIEEQGFANDIYNHPQKAYTQALIAAIPKGEIENVKIDILKKKHLRDNF
ncbi:MAG: ABC transporter ATP-binding protein [Bacteroidetes bacterium]|nr:MAG: ABC transporter ATP-binding protein [Bacteroidota bacterium]